MTVSKQIIEVLNYLGEKFGIVIDWSSENVIPYVSTLCQKLVSYEIWTSVAWIAIMTILSVVAMIVAIRGRVFSYDFVDIYDGLAVFAWTALCLLWLIAIACIGVQIFDIIKCVTFPEMFVFEYIQDIVNSAG